VVLLWCSLDGCWLIPVGFRLWRPKRSCRPERYQTKLQLAADLVRVVVSAKLPVRYVVGDTHYTAGWFTKRLARLGLSWHGTLDSKTTVVWRGKKQAVRDLAASLDLKWRQQLGLRAGIADLCAQVRTGAVGRDQKASRQLRVSGEQCPARRSDDHGATQAQSLVS
jgi:hypothetical protein